MSTNGAMISEIRKRMKKMTSPTIARLIAIRPTASTGRPTITTVRMIAKSNASPMPMAGEAQIDPTKCPRY